MDEKASGPFTRACVGAKSKCSSRRRRLTPQYLSNRPLNCQPGNASTPTEPTGRCLLTSDCRSETGNYKGRSPNCQAPVRQGIPSLITGSVRGVEIGFVFDRGYVTDIIKCQTPHAIPPSNKSKNTAAPKTINLNFLYRLLSGGARDP